MRTPDRTIVAAFNTESGLCPNFAHVFSLPNEARDKRKFNNGIGKAKFVLSEIDSHDLRSGEYLMMTIRSHDQFNTTIYGLNDRYRAEFTTVAGSFS